MDFHGIFLLINQSCGIFRLVLPAKNQLILHLLALWALHPWPLVKFSAIVFIIYRGTLLPSPGGFSCKENVLDLFRRGGELRLKTTIREPGIMIFHHYFIHCFSSCFNYFKKLCFAVFLFHSFMGLTVLYFFKISLTHHQIVLV